MQAFSLEAAKPWWQSRGVYAGAATVLVGVAQAAFGLQLDQGSIEQIFSLGTGVATTLLGGGSIWFRVMALAPVATKLTRLLLDMKRQVEDQQRVRAFDNLPPAG